MNPVRTPLVVLLLLAMLLPALASAQQQEPAIDRQTPRPRVGLVLSGGGARGLAHVGVLKVLEQMQVPIDAIAGTSMGAIVGGLYASGLPADEIEALVRTLDWNTAFQDRPARRDLDYRRKQEERQFLVRLPVGFDRDGFHLPRGLIQGQKLTQVLRRETLPVADLTDFDQLPVPFRAVATDIEDGRPVVLDGGDLTTAMRASMSAPGVFAPVELGDRLLVDGGLVDNLPVDVARAMGVDVVIAVDVSFKTQERKSLDSAIALTNQMLAVMIQQQVQAQRDSLRGSDVLIEPDLGSLSSIAFSRVGLLLRTGEQAAREHATQLQALAVGAADWQAYLARRRLRERPPPLVEFLRAEAGSQQYAPRIEAAMQKLVGKPLNAAAAGRGVTRLYGDGSFETVDYRPLREDDLTGLEVTARRKSWGPNYVRFGLELQDDFEGSNSFNAGMRLLFTEIGRFDAEFQADLQIGGDPTLFAELYQPLGVQSHWFVSPQMRLSRRSFDVIEDDFRIAEYLVRVNEIGFDFGRELGHWGEASLGLLRARGSSRLRVGESSATVVPRSDFDIGEVHARFGLDRLDNVYFPRQGDLLTLEWSGARRALGADYDANKLAAEWMVARSRGRDTWVLWLSGGSHLSAPADAIQDYYSLGGLFNLSGRVADSVSGPHFAIARGIYYRRIGRGGEGFLNVPSYAGVSLELGNAWTRRADISFNSARVNGAGFLGLDTPLGPVYLAVGFDEGGGNAFYLLLGRIR